MGHLNSDGSESTGSPEQRDPLEKLKQRYVEGEISEAEFEKRLETLLDADYQAESIVNTPVQRVEQSKEK